MATASQADGSADALTRLERQVAFILEIDKLKQVLRQTRLTDGSRRENDAEHCWHLALMAMVLSEHAGCALDLTRVLKMLLIHDIVEIDAGDTFLYDAAGAEAQAEREAQAAARIFGLLPPDQSREMHALWHEFEERSTAEAKFARALDRPQPLLQNHSNAGGTWREFGITVEQVMTKKHIIADGGASLWELATGLIEDSVARGYLGVAGESA